MKSCCLFKKGARTHHGHVKLVQNEKKVTMAVKQAARSERLLQEQSGYVSPKSKAFQLLCELCEFLIIDKFVKLKLDDDNFYSFSWQISDKSCSITL